MLDHAYVMAAGKNLGSAESAAQEALTRARNLGLFRLQLEASLALGQIQMIGQIPTQAALSFTPWRKAPSRKGLN